MKNSIKFLVTFAIAIMTNACGAVGGFHTGLENGNTRAQEARLQLEACQDAGNCNREQQAAISASPELATRRQYTRPTQTPFAGQQGMMPGMMPGYGQGIVIPGLAPNKPTPEMVYIFGDVGGSLQRNVAALDASDDTCAHTCIRLYVDQGARGGLIDVANMISLEVDHNLKPIYFGGTVPEPRTQVVLPDGTRKILEGAYLVPPPKDFRTGIRYKLPNARNHTITITLYRMEDYDYSAFAAYEFTASNLQFNWNILSGNRIEYNQN